MGCCIASEEAPADTSPLITSNPTTKVSLDSFNIERVLGQGAFGKVFLVTKKDTNQVYAMKCYKKHLVQENEQRTRINNEREIMQELNHPFLITLRFAFQTDKKLYLVMDFIPGGELFFHLKKNRRFTEEKVRFYSAEILVALNYLHKAGVVYRDLKPENILLDSEGHVKITDFGLSKKLREKTFSFCGTPEYLAPEILKDQGYDHSVDYWSLGILIYEMLSGTPPFSESNQMELYKKILKVPIPMKNFFSNQAINLLNSLLTADPKTRLSNFEKVKKNPFFEGINWQALERKEITPPYKPRILGPTDVRNFDKEFTDGAIESYESEKMSSGNILRNKYEGFSYNPR